MVISVLCCHPGFLMPDKVAASFSSRINGSLDEDAESWGKDIFITHSVSWTPHSQCLKEVRFGSNPSSKMHFSGVPLAPLYSVSAVCKIMHFHPTRRRRSRRHPWSLNTPVYLTSVSRLVRMPRLYTEMSCVDTVSVLTQWSFTSDVGRNSRIPTFHLHFLQRLRYLATFLISTNKHYGITIMGKRGAEAKVFQMP